MMTEWSSSSSNPLPGPPEIGTDLTKQSFLLTIGEMAHSGRGGESGIVGKAFIVGRVGRFKGGKSGSKLMGVEVVTMLIKREIMVKIQWVFHGIKPVVAVMFMIKQSGVPIKVRSEDDVRESGLGCSAMKLSISGWACVHVDKA